MIAVQSDIRLADWCTLNVGGPARWFRQATTESEVLELLQWADERKAQVLILGGGSNVVIADSGFDGLVVRIGIGGISQRESGSKVIFEIGSGEDWDPFVEMTVDQHCAGLECLSGIPGLLGGTPVQNVGAYGQDVSATIRTVCVIDRATRAIRTLSNAECGFGYRTSRFKHDDAGRFVVTRVEFALEQNGAPTITYADVVKYFESRGGAAPSLHDVRHAILEIRSRKGMVIEEGNPANKSVGSFFVNPVVSRTQFDRIGNAPHYLVGQELVKVPAAWLIEQAGFPKGYVAGRVGISPFQAQGLINRGGAAAADIVALAADIKRAVWEMFGIALVPEPVFIGFGSDSAVRWLLDSSPERPCPRS